jgi:hypothetical protein
MGGQDGEHAPGPEAPDEPGRETHTKPGRRRRDRLTESLELADPPVRLGRRLGAELGEEPGGLAGLHGGEARIEVPGQSLGLEAGPDDVGSARHRASRARSTLGQCSEGLASELWARLIVSQPGLAVGALGYPAG